MKILVVSPHPDDETLGAGGTLLKMKDEGHKIYWLNVTNMKEEYGYTSERIHERQQEIDNVKRMYKVDDFIDLGLEPAGLDKYDKGVVVGMFKGVLDEIKPELLILPYGYDVHSDHHVVYEALYASIKSFRAPYIKTVLCMEILSETDQASSENCFEPNVFVDISNYIDKKLEVMKNYKSEISEAPFPRNEEAIKGLASYRGATSYYRYAEAFKLVRGRIS